MGSPWSAVMKLNLITNVPEQYNRMSSAASKFGNVNHGVMSQAQKDIQGFGQLAKGFLIGNLVYDSIRKVGTVVAGVANQWVQFDQISRAASTRWDEVANGTMTYNQALEKTKKITMQVQGATKFTADEVALGMNKMASSGYSLAQANANTMMTIAKFATVSEVDFATATNGLTGSMAAWGESFDNIQSHASQMAVAANASRMEIIDLAEAARISAPLYSTLGLKQVEFYKMLMAMSRIGVVGAEAATRQRGIVSALFRGQTRTEMMKIGISVADKSGNLRAPLEIIGELRDKMKDLGTAEKGFKLKKMFEQYELATVMDLMSLSKESFDSIGANFNNTTNLMDQQFERIGQSIGNKWKTLVNTFSQKVITGLETGAPAVTGMIDQLTASVSKFDMTKINAFISANLPQVIGLLSESFRIISPIATDLMKVLGITLEILLFYSPILTPLVGLYLKWKILTYAIAGYQALLAFTTGILNGKLLLNIELFFALSAGQGILATTSNAVTAAFTKMWVAIGGPIGLAIAIFAGIAIAIWQISKNWDEWGNGITTFHEKFKVLFWVFMPMVGILIDIINRWDMIKNAFTDGGLIAGIKALGGVILSSLLDPVYMVAEMLNKIGILSDKNFKRFRLFKAGLAGDLHQQTPLIMKTGAVDPTESKYGNLPIQTGFTSYGQEQPVFAPDYGQTAQTMPSPIWTRQQVGVDINVSSEKGLVPKTNVSGSTGGNAYMGPN